MKCCHGLIIHEVLSLTIHEVLYRQRPAEASRRRRISAPPAYLPVNRRAVTGIEYHACKVRTARPACVYSLVSQRHRPSFCHAFFALGGKTAQLRRTHTAQARGRTASPRRRKCFLRKSASEEHYCRQNPLCRNRGCV